MKGRFTFWCHGRPLPEILEALTSYKGQQVSNPRDADVALSFGGDGTFLSAAKEVGDSGTPILGINTGHLGYLAATSPDHPQEIARRIAASAYRVSPRGLISVSILDSPDAFALNETAFLRDGPGGGILTCRVWVDGDLLGGYPGDGIIMATPTGSTAYSLSAGGPVLQPEAPARVLTPVAVHVLAMRPVVISDGSVVEVEAVSRSGAFRVSLDGVSTVLASGTRVTLRRAPYNVNVLVDPDVPWTRTLARKLGWGRRPD